MTTPSRSVGALNFFFVNIIFFSFDYLHNFMSCNHDLYNFMSCNHDLYNHLGERRGSISLAGSDASSSLVPGTTRTRRMSTTKIVDTRPKHLMLGDFELANVV